MYPFCHQIFVKQNLFFWKILPGSRITFPMFYSMELIFFVRLRFYVMWLILFICVALFVFVATFILTFIIVSVVEFFTLELVNYLCLMPSFLVMVLEFAVPFAQFLQESFFQQQVLSYWSLLVYYPKAFRWYSSTKVFFTLLLEFISHFVLFTLIFLESQLVFVEV